MSEGIAKTSFVIPVSAEMVDDLRTMQDIRDAFLAEMHESILDLDRPRYGPHRRRVIRYSGAFLETLTHSELLAEAKDLFGIVARGEDADLLDRGRIEEWEYR